MHEFTRHEWLAWASYGDPDVGFSDYGMRDPAPPVEGGVAPIPNLRYTVGEEWLVHKAKAAENRFYAELAIDLLQHDSWMGAGHCAGCARIERCAHGEKGRTAAQAIQFAMTHHFTCVTRQLANSVVA